MDDGRRAGLREILVGVAVGAVLALLFFEALPVFAGADGLSSTDHLTRVIAYEGTVSLGGETYEGELDLRVTLYDDGDQAVWTEERSTEVGRLPVEVDRGCFSVLLGEHTTLTDAVLGEPTLTIGVEARPAPSGSWTTLAGRQLLGTAPQALWAAKATDLTVAGTLSTEDGARFNVDVDVAGDLVLEGGAAEMTLGQAENGTGTAGVKGFSFPDSSSRGAMQLVYRTSPNALLFEGDNGFGDGADLFSAAFDTGAVQTYGGVIFGSTLTVSGDLTVATPGDTNGDDEGLILDGGDIHLGLGNDDEKFLAFEDTTAGQGMQLKYNPGANAFALEVESDLADADNLMIIDIDSDDVWFAGALDVDTKLVLAVADFTSEKTLESNGADKVFFSDSGCTNGALGVNKGGAGQPAICVCFGSTSQRSSRGWYCWE